MWVVAPILRRQPPFGTLLLVGSYAVDRVEVYLRGGERVLGAHVPDDHELAAVVRDRVKRLPDLHVVEDGEVTTTAPPVAPAAPQPDPAHVRAQLLALRNGWTARDIEGTWDGSDSDSTTRSPVTGLSIVEMAQVVVPPDWEAMRSTGFPPWSSSHWRPPFPSWASPPWTRAHNVPPAPEPVVVSDPPVVLDEADSPTLVFDDGADAEAAALSEEPAETDPAGPSYPAESVDKARAVLSTLFAENNRAPSLGKANARLGRLNLPRIPDSTTLTWLLQRP